MEPSRGAWCLECTIDDLVGHSPKSARTSTQFPNGTDPTKAVGADGTTGDLRRVKRLGRIGELTVKGYFKRHVALCALLAASYANQAGAQTATPARAEKANDNSGAAADIVVTANRRSEALSTVPISIAAYTGDDLRESGVKSMIDLAQKSPGVQFDQSAGFGAGTQTFVSIRGIASTIGTSTTGVYIDDTPVQSRVAALSYFGNPYPALFDLERVEVLRGPQGSLFGAGAEGGAIRFITPSPKVSGVSATARSEIGFIDGGGTNLEAGVAVGAPIIEGKLGFRASFWTRHDGGYIDRINPLTGDVLIKNTNSANAYAGRLAFAFVPSDGITITPAIYFQRQTNADAPLFYLSAPQPADSLQTRNIADPKNGVFLNGRLLRQPFSDRVILPSLKVEVGLGGATLTSITSYVDRRGKLLSDTTQINGAFFGTVTGFDENGPIIVPGYGNPNGPEYPTSYDQAGPQDIRTSLKSITQEVRISSDGGGPFKWTAGLFYLHTEQTDFQRATSPFVVQNYILPLLPNSQGLNDPILYSQITQTDEQYSVFGQADLGLTDKLTLTVGGRLSHHKADYNQEQSGFLSAAQVWGPLVTSSGGQSETPWSGKVALDYKFSPTLMVYGSASRGYRIGGANQPISSTCGVSNIFKQTYNSDYVNSFEAGSKGRIGRKIRFDVDAFYVKWKNVQQNVVFPCAFGYIDNTGDATVSGFDASLDLDVVRNLKISGSVSYAKATFSKTVLIPGVAAGDPGSLVVRKGDQVNPYQSPWNLSASAEYSFDVGTSKAKIRIENIYRSKNNGPFTSDDPRAVNFDPLRVYNPATNQVNGRATIAMGDLEFAIFVQNLTNSRPLLFQYRDSTATTLFTANTFTPRTIGASIDFRY
ncbi:TonB-dependent receptor [Sphingomonas sp. TX0543]|uniref:TonB-dependent receptor n=1 Tax=Sphingomonas sp. TX0543 TaxID=3399682 RepID=UPI003AFB76A7